MEPIDRRLLLGAVGLASIAALSKSSKAGPLSPPPGAATSTGRTLDEVYNKIPGANGTGDGRIPIPGGAAAVTLALPGSYVLTGNITVASGAALAISTDNVTVDLNGYTITSPVTAAATLVIGGLLRQNVRVRNGTVTGALTGISVPGASNNIFLEDLTVLNAKTIGINIGISTSRNNVVRRCSIHDTGSTTTAADGNLTLYGIQTAGSTTRVEDCSVSRMLYLGSGTPTINGIRFTNFTSSGNIISGCTVVNDAPITGLGIAGPGSIIGMYRNNAVVNFSSPYTMAGSWVNGGGNV
ncbi:hypothetical protein [Synechococcus sp. Cruz CV-v-12]|uniref:hypothetical protein n=1 Tax=Synechococcus sp. Cruz CV-v-12 TaxID=2823728 RepID=UPI0020CC9E63|nr:hypothetical protein [Synechococcus sp. Cruz CV-v-12]MCP9874365.1 hypothetical protein [Synechococcus sp. Cruz CV-v-12]